MKTRCARRARNSTTGSVLLILFGVSTASAQANLQLKYPEDQTREYRTTSNTFQVLNLMGMEIQSTEKRSVVSSATNAKRRADKSQSISIKTLSLRSDLKLQGGIELSFDSSKPDSFSGGQNFAALGDVYRLQSELAYDVILDERGTPKTVEGLEAFRDKASKFDPISQEMVQSQVDPEKIKTHFEQEQRVLPDHPVRPGETWERSEAIDSQGGLVLSVRKKYEYAGTETKGKKVLDRITSKVLEIKHSVDPLSKLPLKVIKSNLKVESSEGSAVFDRELGCLVEFRDRMNIKGDVTLSGGGMDLPSELTLIVRTEKTLQSPHVK